MKILLDECIPRRLKNELSDYKCQTVPEAGMAGRRIAILIVRARSNRFDDLLPHLEACRSFMRSIQPGEVIRVGE